MKKEDIDLITNVQGFDGDVIGIAVTGGVNGNATAIKFTLSEDTGAGSGNPKGVFSNLQVGYPVYIFDTNVGHGVTSVFSDGAIVSTGTTCLDNVYLIDDINLSNKSIICNIMTGVNTTGVVTSSTGFSGRFSWGRLTGNGLVRSSNPISIGVTGKTLYSGISTFPTIQRRDFGLRNTGALRKNLP